MDFGLSGKVALLTGAAGGIGAGIARALAAEGCDLALVDRAALGGVASALRDLGRRALEIPCDVANWAQAEAAIARTEAELGRFDVLVCCAGITRDGASWKMSEEAWDEVLAVNLKGTFTFCRAAAKRFKAQGSGRIVNVASINGLRGKFGQANYAASKAGTIALAKTLAKELGRYGVTVNAVAPGLVETEMTRRMPPEAFQAAISESLLGRAAAVEDVADAVTFLCSHRARHITGEVLRVDGGQYV